MRGFAYRDTGQWCGLSKLKLNRCAWRRPDDLHLGLWRAPRKVLEKIAPPYVRHVFSPDGITETQCPCLFLRDQFLKAGFTVVRAGQAGHAQAR